jgi:hypothetical protein
MALHAKGGFAKGVRVSGFYSSVAGEGARLLVG